MDWLSLNHLAAYAFLFVGLLGSVSIRMWLDERELTSQVLALSQTTTQLQQEIERFNAANPVIQKDPQLDQRVAQLEKRYQNKKQALSYLSGRSFGNRTGFSSHFRQLARMPYPDMWLTQISFNRGGKEAVFTGRTVREDAIFTFINGLQEGKLQYLSFPYFKVGRIIKQADVTNLDDPQLKNKESQNALLMRFSLSTQLAALNDAWTRDLNKAEQTEAAIQEVRDFQDKTGETMNEIGKTVSDKTN